MYGKLLKPLAAAALVCAVTACDVPDTIMENGAITLKGDAVTLHLISAPRAVIHADGNFVVNGKSIAITPAERALLVRYYQSVHAVYETGVAMGKAGLDMAAKAVTATASSSTDKATTDVSGRVASLSQDICKDTAAIKAVQDQLAAQLDAFRPYASIVGASDLDDCRSDAKANPSPTTP